MNTIQTMSETLRAATTVAALDALYVDWIGYSIVEDDAEATEESIREILTDYIKEVCYAAGVHCSTIQGLDS